MPAVFGYITVNSRLRSATLSSIIRSGMPRGLGYVVAVSLSSGMPSPRLTNVVDVTQDQAQCRAQSTSASSVFANAASHLTTAPVSSARLATLAAGLTWLRTNGGGTAAKRERGRRTG